MERKEQEQFVNDLCENVKRGALDKIKTGKVPENWDGIELRWYLAQLFEESTLQVRRGDRGNQRRLRDFKNHVLVNNL